MSLLDKADISEQTAHGGRTEAGTVATVHNDPDAVTHSVYFLYCAGFIKIGVTNKLIKRMGNLQGAVPFPTQAVLLIPGGRLTEEYMHHVFAEYRARGEWFRLGPRIRDAISRLSPDDCKTWLAEEEAAHRNWIEGEAGRLGLLAFTRDDIEEPRP